MLYYGAYFYGKRGRNRNFVIENLINYSISSLFVGMLILLPFNVKIKTLKVRFF